jgi:hypothetical protein
MRPLLLAAVLAMTVSGFSTMPPQAEPNDPLARFQAGPLSVRRDLLANFPTVKPLKLLLAAVQDPHDEITKLAMEPLQKRSLSDADRQAVIKEAEQMWASGVMRLRLTAAQLAAMAGDARSFDWALECLQDFNDSGQPKIGYRGAPLAGVPGTAAGLMVERDRPGFARYLALVRKGEKAAALRDVAGILAPHDGEYGIRDPLEQESAEGLALCDGLKKIGTPLAKELAAIIFRENAAIDLLTAEEQQLALTQKATEKDFDIEVGRRPFDKPGAVEVRLKKVTPGKVVCGPCYLNYDYGAGPFRDDMGRFVISSRRRAPLAIGVAVFGQGECIGSLPLPPPPESAGEHHLVVACPIRLAGGPPITLNREFDALALKPDASHDLEEYLRRLNSTDTRESYGALDLFGGGGNAPNRPLALALAAEVRDALRTAIAKKLKTLAFADFPEDYNSLRYGEEHSWNELGLARCLAAMEALGTGTDETWLVSLLDAKSHLAAHWAYHRLRERWGMPLVDAKWPGLCRELLASDNPFAVRNALLLLADVLGNDKTALIELSGPLAKLAAHASPLVRTAVATLTAERADGLDPTGLLKLADDPDAGVAREALVGLSAYLNPDAPPTHPTDPKKVLALYERFMAGADKDRAKAVREAVQKISHPAFIPLLYHAQREEPGWADNEDREGYLSAKLDETATAFLLDRLKADPADRIATGFLFTGGYQWPADTRQGRLQKLLRENVGGCEHVNEIVQGALVRLAAADKKDKTAAAAFAAALRLHLRQGDARRTGQDCLALAALGVKTDAPLDKVFLETGYGNGPPAPLAAVLVLYVTDRESARAPLLAMLREGSPDDNDNNYHNWQAAAALARRSPWPEARALAGEPKPE